MGKSLLTVVSVAAGMIVLVLSPMLLFSQSLRGRLDARIDTRAPALEVPHPVARARSGLDGAFALVACFLIGAGLIVFADAGWAHAAGVVFLFAFAASAFVLVATVPDERFPTGPRGIGASHKVR